MKLAMLIGRLTRDVEIRKTTNNTTIANFTLACESYKNGEKCADFIDCKAWGKFAETIVKVAKKGTRLGVSGTIEFNNYTKKDGTKVKDVFVNVASFELLSSSNKNEQQDIQDENVEEVSVEDEMPF